MVETVETYQIEAFPVSDKWVQQQLDGLAVMREQADGMVADIDAEISKLQAMRMRVRENIDIAIANVEASIRENTEVLAHSVKGIELHAVYSPGTRKWDNGKLMKYVVAHPEIIACSSMGMPSVSIRKVQ